mmetsp:Transcript_34102/g.109547  ORF Transcript_34102/g.109547 Transcript_34102/m.109547 type:complete len:202 (-) Transcript_34102:1084-1689(-)
MRPRRRYPMWGWGENLRETLRWRLAVRRDSHKRPPQRLTTYVSTGSPRRRPPLARCLGCSLTRAPPAARGAAPSLPRAGRRSDAARGRSARSRCLLAPTRICPSPSRCPSVQRGVRQRAQCSACPTGPAFRADSRGDWRARRRTSPAVLARRRTGRGSSHTATQRGTSTRGSSQTAPRRGTGRRGGNRSASRRGSTATSAR